MMDTLKRKGRFLLILGCGFMGGMFSRWVPFAKPAWAHPVTGFGEPVKAESFELVDQKGQTRARLNMSTNGFPAFELLSEDGQPLVSMKGYRGGGLIVLSSSGQKTQVLLNANGNSPRIMVANNHRALVSVDVASDGEPSIQLFNGQQKSRLSMAVDRGNAYLAVMDEQGTTRNLLSVGADGLPALSLGDATHPNLASFEVKPNGEPALTLRNKEGAAVVYLTTLSNGRGDLSVTH